MQLQFLGGVGDQWDEALGDACPASIPDQVAFRLDFECFLATLSERDRRLILVLALGHPGRWAARLFGLSAARISQLRQQWQREWHAFLGEPDPAAA